MPTMLHVRILRGTGAGTEREVPTDRPIRVGRDPGCALCIPDGRASREHAEIHYEMGSWWVTDLGSTNGTLVGGSRIERAPVGPGDEVQIGDTAFTVGVVDDSAAAGHATDPASGALPASDRRAGSAPPVRAAEPAAAPEIDPPLASPPSAAVEEPPAGPIELVPMLASVEPLGADAAVPPPQDPAAASRLLDALKTAGGSRAYAVVDAARALELIGGARQRGLDAYSLFSGELAREVAHVGPGLLPLPDLEPDLGALATSFAGSWCDALGSLPGVLLTTDADLDAIARHLRDVFLATDDEGVAYFFRFYDPRVFRAYLPTCTPDERRAFFGPVKGWLVESETGEPELFTAT